MKTRNRIAAVVVALMMLVVPVGAFAADAAKNAQPKEVSIVFSHDMHSHLDSESVMVDGKQSERGGLARTSTKMSQIVEEYPDTMLVDAGDFSVGTAYQLVFSTQAAELRMMGKVNYDVVGFGNHELDYGAQGLADMLNTAMASGDELPQLVCANIDWKASLAEKNEKEGIQNLKDACDEYGVKEYTVIEKDGVKIAVFGLMGADAIDTITQSNLKFDDPIESAKRVVADIEENEDVDVIVCLSHGGTWDDPKISEDEILAAEVPEINVIVSAHTHTELPEAIMVGDTAVVSCGQHNYNLGHVVLKEQKDGSFALSDYEVVPLDASIEKDTEVLADLEKFRATTNEGYFDLFGYTIDQVLVTNNLEFTPSEKFADTKGEDTLGNLITDAYIYAVKQVEGEDSVPVDVAVAPAGVIRASIPTGKVTAADAFNVLSMGRGPDGIAGYPLVSVYVTGKELKDAAEVDATVSDLMPDARLYMAGLKFDYNMNRMFLNRATDVQLILPNGNLEELEDDRLYRVIADMYSGQRLGLVKEQSYGLLSIIPKDENGTPIEDYTDYIIYDGDMELKAWYAVASYLESFEDGQIPEKYAELEGRKNDVTSWNPVELLKQPNKVGYITMAVVVILILAVFGIVKLVKRIHRKRKEKK